MLITYVSPFDPDLKLSNCEMSQGELSEIEGAARSFLESSGVFQHRSVRVEKLGENTYTVLFAGNPREHKPGIRESLRTFLFYCTRRCTSCGLMGCGYDLKRPLTILDIVGIHTPAGPL